jgi:2-polyprenyl-6-methoxyphenol hydroxylase-like FAD-dependent oxidoreductase
MATVRRIAVVGAGLAGLACALAAAMAGAAVEVFEAAAAPADPPAHVDLVPNLWRDLVALGVGHECLRDGFAYHGTALADGAGTPTIVWATPALAGPRWPAAVGMRCGHLLRVLADAARSHGVQLHWGRGVVSIDEACAALRLDGGDEHRADLVLLASGRHDLLHRHGPARSPAAAATHHWWTTLLPRPQGLERPTWIVSAGGGKLQLVPVASDTAGLALAQPSPLPSRPEERSDALRRALAAQGPAARTLADRLSADIPTAQRAVQPQLLAGAWYRGALLCVGECAHALAPHFGQSAAQALEDATVIGALLRDGLAREALLERFMARRSGRAQQVFAITRQAARWDLHPVADTDLDALLSDLGRIVATPA